MRTLAGVAVMVTVTTTSCAVHLRQASPPLSTPAFRESCMHFLESEFGVRTASGLRGTANIRSAGLSQRLGGLQVAARSAASGEVFFAFTAQDGSFEVGPLEPGSYQVWTCLDGFDQLRFELIVDPTSSIELLQLLVAPSEGVGDRGVVGVEDGGG